MSNNNMEGTRSESLTLCSPYIYFMKWIAHLEKIKAITPVIENNALTYEIKKTYCERFFSLTIEKKGVPVLGVFNSPETHFFSDLVWQKAVLNKTKKSKSCSDFLLLGFSFTKKAEHFIYLKLPISKQITPMFETFDILYLGTFKIKNKKTVFGPDVIKIKREFKV